jgi:DNA-binding CsgD family transcriptional regulator
MSAIDTPAQWLANAATIAMQLLPPRAVALASVAKRENDNSDWLPIAIGIGGTNDNDFARRLERTSRLPSEMGNQRGPFVYSCTRGTPMVYHSCAPDSRDVSSCAYLGARRELSLHSLLRACVHFPVNAHQTMLVIQVDGRTADWTPTEEHGECLTQFTDAVSIGYASRFIEPGRFQETLLGKLSQTQRLIVPYLIEEKSEREIASALDRSRHTIHEHVKAIYQSWDVHSRHQAREVWLGRPPKPIA